MYANIIVEIAHEDLDRTFQYHVPANLENSIEVGQCVKIPFGKGNRMITGYVIELTDEASFDPARIKDLCGIVKNQVSVEDKQIQLAAWIHKEYGSTMIQALKTVLPVKKNVKKKEKKTVSLLISREEAMELLAEATRKKRTAQARLLTELIDSEGLDFEIITGKLNVSATTVNSLAEKGVLEVLVDRVYRNPFNYEEGSIPKKILSPKQEDIVNSFMNDFYNGRRGTYVIRGITGSGKTEVYMELISKVVKEGKQAIVLIPEIALTYQTAKRFYSRFGDRVSVMNSTLSDGEKYDQFERARVGELDVMIGPRSALFTPFSNVGLIVIDEEHENSYKSETMPRFHAREAAIELARLHNASVILGSATPSLEATYRAKQGIYKEFILDERLNGGALPSVDVVDLRQELKNGNRSIFSLRLQELMADRLDKGEQIMLFLNRRGYAGFISCRSCGTVIKCPHCDVSMSEHNNSKLVCHYCGYTTPSVKICPKCGSKYVSGFKAGTQQIEEKLNAMFPKARVLRMDADTTRRKDSYEEILSAFANKEADILVGTQMIVKGHDFPDVTLMGIIAADMSLAVGDFRCAERTFQLLTQAAGRAGRSSKPGNVVIQTYQPDHYAVVYSAAQDYEAFYKEEIAYRSLMDYPPACHMLSVLVTSPDEAEGERLSVSLAGELRAAFPKTVIIGPAPAGIGKINDLYRFQFYVKSQDEELLNSMKRILDERIKEMELKKESVVFDYDPINMF